jgi:fumarate reductase subunit C
MTIAAHKDAMKPRGRTRTPTAPPMMAGNWWTKNPRYVAYVAYAYAGVFFWLQALIFIRGLWALGSGEAAWNAFLADLQNPIYVGFHVLSLAVLVWYGARTYFKLFVKTQPPKMGPLPRPPLAVFPPALAAAWIGASAILIVILGGIWP